MAPARMSEVEERAARLEARRGNGGPSVAPSADDLDWLLFHSFPGSEVGPARFVELLPRYIEALDGGGAFDFELLFVRVLEIGDRVPAPTRAELARAAARRTIAGGFDAADSIAALRFAIRTMPPGDVTFLDALASDPRAARLRFDLTLDFLLDERELADYLALSYLREGDPDADPVLARFPIPAGVRTRLVEFFDEAACRRRIRDGWAEWVDEAERATLIQALRSRWPDFAPGAI